MFFNGIQIAQCSRHVLACGVASGCAVFDWFAESRTFTLLEALRMEFPRGVLFFFWVGSVHMKIIHTAQGRSAQLWSCILPQDVASL